MIGITSVPAHFQTSKFKYQCGSNKYFSRLNTLFIIPLFETVSDTNILHSCNNAEEAIPPN